jgi:hypothetical protein
MLNWSSKSDFTSSQLNPFSKSRMKEDEAVGKKKLPPD